MRWVKMYPRWLGWVFAAFGLSIVVGAIFEFSKTPEMTLPGVVVGAVWALVGIKAGLPLFPTVSSQPDAGAMASGLRKIVWRRRMSWLAMLALVPVFFVALPHVPERHVPTMFLLSRCLPRSSPFPCTSAAARGAVTSSIRWGGSCHHWPA